MIDTKDAGYSSSESEEETAAEKKLRLAKQYLAHIEQEGMEYMYITKMPTVLFKYVLLCNIFIK